MHEIGGFTSHLIYLINAKIGIDGMDERHKWVEKKERNGIGLIPYCTIAQSNCLNWCAILKSVSFVKQND